MRVTDSERDENMILTYLSSAKLGRELQDKINKKDTSYDEMSLLDKQNLHTYQFGEYWLSDYKMREISWLVVQFPWLVAGRALDKD